jgi:hypothetical protein
VNTKGEVLGFVDFKNAQETQAFNFMRPASTIKELAVPGSEYKLDSNAQAYRTGLTAYFNGDRATAVKNLSKVANAQPTNKYAKDYLAKAKKLPMPPKPKSSFPVLGLVIGLVVLLLIGGLVALLLLRKGKKPAAGAPAGMAYPPAGQPPMPGAPAAPGAAPVGVGAPAAPAPGQYPQQQAPGQYPPPPAQAPQAPGQVAAPPAPQPQQPPSESAPTAPLGFTAPPPPAQPPAAPVPGPGQGEGPSAQAGPAAPQAGHTFCSSCGARHDPAAKFCANCGAAQ